MSSSAHRPSQGLSGLVKNAQVAAGPNERRRNSEAPLGDEILLETETLGDDFVPAGFGIRSLATASDCALVLMLSSLPLFVYLLTLASPGTLYTWGAQWDAWRIALSGAGTASSASAFELFCKHFPSLFLLLLITGSIAILYFALFEAYFAATPGKMLLGLVVAEKETRMALSFAHAAARNLAKVLSAIPLCLGFSLCVITVDKQALHDLICGSIVCRRLVLPLWRIIVGAALAILLPVASVRFVTLTNAALRARVSHVVAPPAPRSFTPIANEVVPADSLIPANSPSSSSSSPSDPITNQALATSYGEVDGDRILLKHTLALVDDHSHSIAIYFFSEKREPKSEVDIESFIARADLKLTLYFGSYHGNYDVNALTRYVVGFYSHEDGFMFDGRVPVVEFERPRAWSGHDDNVEISSTTGAGQQIQGVVSHEGRWQKNKRSHTFRWHFAFSTVLLDKKIVPVRRRAP